MGLSTGGVTKNRKEILEELQIKLLIEEIRKTDPDKAACLDEGRTDCFDPLNIGWVPIAPGGGPGLASSASRVVPWLARTFGLAGKAATPATITTSAETAATSALSVSGTTSEMGILFSITEAASNTRSYLWLAGCVTAIGASAAALWDFISPTKEARPEITHEGFKTTIKIGEGPVFEISYNLDDPGTLTVRINRQVLQISVPADFNPVVEIPERPFDHPLGPLIDGVVANGRIKIGRDGGLYILIEGTNEIVEINERGGISRRRETPDSNRWSRLGGE